MNIKEYLINSKNKLLKKKPVDDKVDTVEDDIEYNGIVMEALDAILDDASIDFFPKDGTWYSNCFRRSTDLNKGNLPCHLRNNRWMAHVLKEDQKLFMISTKYIEEYMNRSKKFIDARHNYELEIVKWQINWMRNGGEGWIVDDELGGDFYIMGPVCDLAFRKGIVDTLTKIGMDSEVVEEGIEKNADLWRDRYMRRAFLNEFDPILIDYSFSIFGEERKNDDINKPTLAKVDPSFEEAWLKMRRYEYYQQHKSSVDKYGVVLPEMLMNNEGYNTLKEEISVKSDLRRQEIEEYKNAKERVRMKRLGKI